MMSIYERDYEKNTTDYRGGFDPTFGLFSNVPPVTRYLLLSNILVFILMLVPAVGRFADTYLSVFPVSWLNVGQVWRIITYQFLHADSMHVFFNMLMLYFLGPLIEQLWGPRTYLRFYLIAGAAGGVVYTLLVISQVLGASPMVGASGAIYGLMAAAAVLFPHTQVYLFGIVPLKMKTLLIITIVMSVMNFMGGQNAGGEAAHLSGIAVGVFLVYIRPRLISRRLERSKGAWQRKIEKEHQFQAEVDRILEKVHREGIGALTRNEKKTLQEATRREQQADKNIRN